MLADRASEREGTLPSEREGGDEAAAGEGWCEVSGTAKSANAKRRRRVRSVSVSDESWGHVEYVASKLSENTPNCSKALETIIGHHETCSFGMKREAGESK